MVRTVGFIGLGLMGNPMAKNILKAGFPLVVYNRTPSKTEELKKLGARLAKTPAELASTVDVVITMVTAPDDVASVLFGPGGVSEGVKNHTLIVMDMSTIGLTAARTIAEKLGAHGIEFIDAPVTGSTPKAISGELTIFVGGKKEVYEKVKPVLLAMGKTIHYMGPAGSGQAIKLVNNYLIAITIAALGEAMVLADIVALPREQTASVLRTVPALSPMMNLKLPNYVSNSYPLLFSMNNMYKDVALATLEMRKKKKKLKLIDLLESLYKKAIDDGYGQEDFSMIIKEIEE